MTDQPTPRQDGQGNDETPAGYQPPQFVPPQGSDIPAPPPINQPQPGQPQFNEPQFSQPGDPGLASPPLYTQPGQQPYGQQAASPYGQPASPYGQPAYYGMPAEPKGLSIASMCCGIAVFVGFGFFILPQIAAVILGHIALNKEPSGRGFAIAGLVMGYIGLALTLLAILAFAFILPYSWNRYTGY